MVSDTVQDKQIRRSIIQSVESMDLRLLQRIAYEVRCEELGIYSDSWKLYPEDWIMQLSDASISKIADALKPAVIDYVTMDEGFIETLQTAIVDGIRDTMGEMDEDLLFEIGMLIFDRIELKWWLKLNLIWTFTKLV